MGKIVPFKTASNIADELSPNEVLEYSKDQFKEILILGYDLEGYLDIRSSSNLSHSDISWLIDLFKQKLLNGDFMGDDE